MSTKLRIGGAVASGILLITMAGIAPTHAAPGPGKCGENGCPLSVESKRTTTDTKTSTSTNTTTSTTTRTRTRTTSNPLMGQATSKQNSSGSSGEGSSGGGSAPAPKAVPLTAAQKAKIRHDNWREESFGDRIFGGCGDSDFPGVAAQCEEPEPEPAAAAPAQQASTRTTTDTETETDTQTRTNTRRQRTVSTREIVDRAKGKIEFDDPDIGSAPCSDANCQGAVGVPVWLWTQELPTQSASATAGGRTVRVKDEVTKVTWDLGDGTSVTCNGSGTSYDSSMGWKTSPDCGVPGGYKKAGTYTVTATFHHRITWSGDASGSETAETTSSETVRIGEYQGVGVRAGGAS